MPTRAMIETSPSCREALIVRIVFENPTAIVTIDILGLMERLEVFSFALSFTTSVPFFDVRFFSHHQTDGKESATQIYSFKSFGQFWKTKPTALSRMKSAYRFVIRSNIAITVINEFLFCLQIIPARKKVATHEHFNDESEVKSGVYQVATRPGCPVFAGKPMPRKGRNQCQRGPPKS